MILSEAYVQAVERRIEWLTLTVGAIGGVLVGAHWGLRAGFGVTAGGMLAWLNFRWLDQVVTSLSKASQGVSIGSAGIYIRLAGRFGLMAGLAYVIFKLSWMEGRAVLAGLFSLICAVLLEVTYELVTGFREPESRA